jgi:hypothetical protein
MVVNQMDGNNYSRVTRCGVALGSDATLAYLDLLRFA